MEWAGLKFEGAFRGILVMWDSRRLSVGEVVKNQFSVSILFQAKNDKSRWISVVYGPPRSRGRGFMGGVGWSL